MSYTRRNGSGSAPSASLIESGVAIIGAISAPAMVLSANPSAAGENYVTGLLYVSDTLPSGFSYTDSALQTASFPGVVSLGPGYTVTLANNAALASFSIPALASIGGGAGLDLSNCALSSASVSALLAQLAGTAFSPFTLNLSGGSNGAPICRVASVTIDVAGWGYLVGDGVTSGEGSFSGVVSSVGESGEIAEVSILDGGSYTAAPSLAVNTATGSSANLVAVIQNDARAALADAGCTVSTTAN